MSNDVNVLDMLRQVDPVDPRRIPGEDSPQARALIEEIAGRRFRGRGLKIVLAASFAAVVAVIPAFAVISGLFGREDIQFPEAPTAASVTKRDFADMFVGAPKGMDPRVIADDTRLVASFSLGDVIRRVWVAPTESGSFCYLFEGISGGCRATARDPNAIQLAGSFALPPGATEPFASVVAGVVFDRNGTLLRVRFEDGKARSLPFVYVSRPIDAGFFAYKPTTAEQETGHRPAQLELLDRDGRTLARGIIDWRAEETKVEEAHRMGFETSPWAKKKQGP